MKIGFGKNSIKKGRKSVISVLNLPANMYRLFRKSLQPYWYFTIVRFIVMNVRTLSAVFPTDFPSNFPQNWIFQAPKCHRCLSTDRSTFNLALELDWKKSSVKSTHWDFCFNRKTLHSILVCWKWNVRITNIWMLICHIILYLTSFV